VPTPAKILGYPVGATGKLTYTKDLYRCYHALADPRHITDAEAQHLIDTGKPFYWASGSIHSRETVAGNADGIGLPACCR
jgi:hypothetical protein